MANGTDTLTLVPPRRLGQLLVGHRTSAGLSVADIAQRTSLLGSEIAVHHLEAGRLPLNDEEMTAVTAAYGVQVDALVPQRSQLIVDLDERTFAVDGHSVAFSGPGSQMTDELLTQYLSLVRALRSLPADAEVVLRDRDLGALSGALVLPTEDIENRLHELMESQPLLLRRRAQRLSLRPLVPALGILVGATAIGGVILTSATQSEALGTRTVSQSTDGVPHGRLDLAGSRSIPTVDSSTARFEAALDLIAYPWESKLPGWTITLQPQRDGYRGITNVAERRIEIYDVSGVGERELAHVIAHEIGHAVDVTYNDTRTRSRWLQSRGIDPNHPWFTGDGLTDFSVGAGDFAESFAHWQVGYGEQSNLGGAPTSDQIILLAELSLQS